MVLTRLQPRAGSATLHRAVPRPRPATAAAPPRRPDARSLYFALYREDGDPATTAAVRRYLAECLREAATLPPDMPLEPRDLAGWAAANNRDADRRFQDYLLARAGGAPRRLFPQGKDQALYALQAVAPAKLVDGAWLYGLVRRWHDPRYRALLRRYLEILGEGRAAHNQVLRYQKLLAKHALDGWLELPERWFIQGAVRLALAHNAEDFLPELIGYSLGCAQPPLSARIAAHELEELGIDPGCFTLGGTADDTGSGQAHAAVQAVLEARPRLGEDQRFMRRVSTGYRLCRVGAGVEEAAGNFDPDTSFGYIAPATDASNGHGAATACRHDGAQGANGCYQEQYGLDAELAALPTRGAKLNRLVPLLSPANHWSAAGLAATRSFCALLAN